MKKRHTVFFVWLLLLYSNGVLHFLQGFLLTRREIHLKSTVSDGVSCCLEPKYRQIIILLIDALRYDFLAYNNSTSTGAIYHNNLPVVHKLMKNDRGVLYQFVADPPTTTMQRLKGMTTGSLPTFIDIGSNFASDELMEDNLISQLTSSSFNVTFMGDETWVALFPKSFQHSFPYPSFDVWDIDTVDRGVEGHLTSEIKKPDWNLLIAHCLGVDHTGHRYGPEHPVMPRKLKEMNSLIEKIVSSMNSQTLLLVMGDHGMTRSGDHGGDSPDEINAGLFAYSPGWKIKFNDSKTQVVSQVDLVPTLSILLGIPIPYSNLGSVILDFVYPEQLFQETHTSEKDNLTIALSYFSDALYINAKQIWRYLETYRRDSPFPEAEFQQLSSKFTHVSDLFDGLKIEGCSQNCLSNSSCCPNHLKLKEFITTAQLFLSEAKEICRSMWARFDLTSIIVGLAIFTSSLLLNATILIDCESTSMKPVSYIGVAGAVFSVLLQRWLIMVVLGLSLAPVLLYLAMAMRFMRFKGFHLTFLVPFFLAVSYTSNSFVVEEPYVVHYLAQSLIWLPLLFKRRTGQFVIRSGLSLSVRLGLAFFRCREEQFPVCEAHSLHRSLTSLSGSNWMLCQRLSLALASCIVLYFILARYLQVDKKIGYLVAIVWCHWIVQSACFLLGGDTSALTFLPKLFYSIFVLKLVRDIYQFVTDNEHAKLATAWRQVSSTEEMWPLYGVLSLHGFFASGHHTSLASIPWEAAFVGISHSSSQGGLTNVLPTFFVSYSTAFSMLLHVMAVPIVALSTTTVRKNKESRVRLANGWLYILFFHAVRLLGCMGAAALHRRHLMVWKIFAPRLLYELLFAVYTSLGIVISLVLFQATM
ncbi:hypothetical protein GHT06_008569 [Daphnia sinensis]|uniref:GPI ethanolamine phosphate transferase 2 C-terminal domain-containing protein n=1 Tax=Daphnia sinensis TaxID=1820382 RepID=A0AAD5LVJ6_9CRUS|nr:hypothetical protein GHT06_008569 [Daphnia sinensis]